MPALDHKAYPHLLDQVAAHADPSALLSLRATSHTWRAHVDVLLARRLFVSSRDIEHPLCGQRERTANTERRTRDAFAHTRSLALDTPEPPAVEFPALTALVLLHRELLRAMIFLHDELLPQRMPYAAPTMVVTQRFRLPAYLAPNRPWVCKHIPIPLVQAADKLVLRTHCAGPSHYKATGRFRTFGNIGPGVRHVVFAFEGYVGASPDPEPEPGAETLAGSGARRTWCMAADVSAFILERRLVRFTLLDVDAWYQTWMWPWPRDVLFDPPPPDNAALFRKIFVDVAQTRFEYSQNEIERAWERVEMVSRDQYRAKIGEEAWADERWDLNLESYG